MDTAWPPATGSYWTRSRPSAAASATPCCPRRSSARWWLRRVPAHRWSKAAWPARSTSSPASRSTSPRSSRSRRRSAPCTRICPTKTDGQYSALGNFKNDAGNFGVMLQLFSETRHLRRDGVEVLGYDTIAPGSPIATAHPDLSGVQYPTEIGAAFFTQERKRTGGIARPRIQADRRSHLRPVRLHVEARGQQLQPQLPVVVDALRQLRRRARRRIPATWCKTTP